MLLLACSAGTAELMVQHPYVSVMSRLYTPMAYLPRPVMKNGVAGACARTRPDPTRL